MRNIPQLFDSYGVRLPTPFGALLVAGTLCSATVIGRAWLPVAAVQADGPVRGGSAGTPLTSVPSYGSPTTVTQVTPTAMSGPAEMPVVDFTPPASLPTATPVPAPQDTVPALRAAVAVAPAPVSSNEKSAVLLGLMNQARKDEGSAELEDDPLLDDVALTRARDLAANGYFDHTGLDGSSAFSELALRGRLYRLAGENLARNNYPEAKTVRAAFDGLMASPGHRANILEERFSRVGVAAIQSGRFWLFVTVFTD